MIFHEYFAKCLLEWITLQFAVLSTDHFGLFYDLSVWKYEKCKICVKSLDYSKLKFSLIFHNCFANNCWNKLSYKLHFSTDLWIFLWFCEIENLRSVKYLKFSLIFHECFANNCWNKLPYKLHFSTDLWIFLWFVKLKIWEV